MLSCATHGFFAGPDVFTFSARHGISTYPKCAPAAYAGRRRRASSHRTNTGINVTRLHRAKHEHCCRTRSSPHKCTKPNRDPGFPDPETSSRIHGPKPIIYDGSPDCFLPQPPQSCFDHLRRALFTLALSLPPLRYLPPYLGHTRIYFYPLSWPRRRLPAEVFAAHAPGRYQCDQPARHADFAPWPRGLLCKNKHPLHWKERASKIRSLCAPKGLVRRMSPTNCAFRTHPMSQKYGSRCTVTTRDGARTARRFGHSSRRKKYRVASSAST